LDKWPETADEFREKGGIISAFQGNEKNLSPVCIFGMIFLTNEFRGFDGLET
jgi:hypothetical protein